MPRRYVQGEAASKEISFENGFPGGLIKRLCTVSFELEPWKQRVEQLSLESCFFLDIALESFE